MKIQTIIGLTSGKELRSAIDDVTEAEAEEFKVDLTELIRRYPPGDPGQFSMETENGFVVAPLSQVEFVRFVTRFVTDGVGEGTSQ